MIRKITKKKIVVVFLFCFFVVMLFLTSIIFLREDYTLAEAIGNAVLLQYLYEIIPMFIHDE